MFSHLCDEESLQAPVTSQENENQSTPWCDSFDILLLWVHAVFKHHKLRPRPQISPLFILATWGQNNLHPLNTKAETSPPDPQVATNDTPDTAEEHSEHVQ